MLEYNARGMTGDDARMDSRGPTVRDPKKMAGDGGTSCPFEGGYEILVESNSPPRYIL